MNVNLQKKENNDFKTMSEQTSAYIPANAKFSRTDGVRWANLL